MSVSLDTTEEEHGTPVSKLIRMIISYSMKLTGGIMAMAREMAN